jgi:phosphate transport system permease protein
MSVAVATMQSRRELVQQTARRSLGRRRLTGRIVIALSIVAVIGAVAPLFAVLAYTFGRGIGALSVDFFTHLPAPALVPGGGIANALVGSLIIDGIAAGMAIPLGVVMGLFLAEGRGRFAGAVRFGADVLVGMPSITIGLFAYAVVVVPSGHFSGFSASVALAVLMLPVVMRTSEAAIRAVPGDLWEAGMALGLRRARIARAVILPAAFPGLVTGALLATARAVGESAPLLFTSIGNQFFQFSPSQPMAAMPLLIYQNGIQAYPDLQLQAWGTALVLVVVVLILNLGSRTFAARLGRYTR